VFAFLGITVMGNLLRVILEQIQSASKVSLV
jgi:hypothetical protein